MQCDAVSSAPSRAEAFPRAAPPPAGMLLFGLVSLQAAFLVPYLVLVPGERTNVFTTLLATLPALWLALKNGRAGLSWRTALPWLILACGLAVSALASPTPQSSGLRALSFFCPAAAGLYCAHGLFREHAAGVLLFRLLTLCFAGLTGAHLVFGASPSFMGLHHHALAGTLLLLSAGPIHLAFTGTRPWRAAAALLLAAGALVCFLAGSRFVILLPFALIPALMLLRRVALKHALLGILASTAVALAFFAMYPGKVPRLVNYESTFYRIEGVPAAWEIVKQEPLFGIGLRTPRRSYLESFEPPFGTVSKKAFLAVVDVNVTWDNQFLSLLVGVGVPLTLLYLGLLARMMHTCLGRVRRHELGPGVEQALAFALLATLVHLFVHDGLLYPQISWFFHVLLGVGLYSNPQTDGPPAPGAAERA